MKRAPRLTVAHRLTIRLALRGQYTRSMECLDLVNDKTSIWLENAGEAWAAYKVVAGHAMHTSEKASS